MNTSKNTTETSTSHIVWDVSDRNHWSIAFKGTLEECENYLTDDETGDYFDQGYEIHPNEIKDSWNNTVTGIHYDVYMDDSVESRPMTEKEIKEEA